MLRREGVGELKPIETLVKEFEDSDEWALYYSTAEDTGRVNQLFFAYHGGSYIHAHCHFKRPATNLGDGEQLDLPPLVEPEVPSILEPAVVRIRGRPRREDTSTTRDRSHWEIGGTPQRGCGRATPRSGTPARGNRPGRRGGVHQGHIGAQSVALDHFLLGLICAFNSQPIALLLWPIVQIPKALLTGSVGIER